MVDLKLEAGYQLLTLYFIIFIFTIKHYLTTVGGGILGSQNLSMNNSNNMIIIDYVMGAQYVLACHKCFIRIVSFNSHINSGGGYYFILYLLHEETGLARITSFPTPKVTQQIDSIPLFITYLLNAFHVFWELRCSSQQAKISSHLELTFQSPWSPWKSIDPGDKGCEFWVSSSSPLARSPYQNMTFLRLRVLSVLLLL